MTATPGRNDLCSCGSGRKYKHCCLARQGDLELRRARFRHRLRAVSGKVFSWVTEGRTPKTLFLGWEDFWLGKPFGEGPLEEHPIFDPTFMTWFLYDWVAWHRGARRGVPRRVPFAVEFSASDAASALDDGERRLLASLIDAPFAFWVVEAAEPGRGLTLREPFSGTVVEVVDLAAAETATVGTVLWSKLGNDGEIVMPVGCAPLALRPALRAELATWRERIFGRRGASLADLHLWQSELRMLFLREVVEILDPRMPKLVNAEGDPLAPRRTVYDLGCPPLEAFEALRDLAPRAAAGPTLERAQRGPEGKIERIELDWVRSGSRDGRVAPVVAGTMVLTPGRLEATTNSARRARLLRRRIEKRLGARVVWRHDVHEGLDAAYEEFRRRRPDRVPEPPPDAASEEVVRQMAERHWRAWLDEPIPMLGGRTPRQAARSRLGREQLAALLDEIALHDARGPTAPDVAALRKKLRM